jgi:alpha-beta hydrolase superfamily lysophospholipase
MLQAHPLRFVADLMTADTRSLHDGSLRVPVTVLASSGDPLLPLPDIEATTQRLAAPRVDLVVVDADCHLILNEAHDVSVPRS